MTFLKPVHVGDVAKVDAAVVFSSMHTVAVSVQVSAERMPWSHSTNPPSSKEEVVCNHALVWLVGVILPDLTTTTVTHKIRNPSQYARALAPFYPQPDPETNSDGLKAYQQASRAYENRKKSSSAIPGSSFDEAMPELVPSSLSSSTKSLVDSNTQFSSESAAKKNEINHCFTPDYSAVELAQVMLPSDCVNHTGLVGGGVVMKLMDNACGVVAVRHCGTNVVTVSVDSVNFKSPVLLGDVLRVRARPTFTSQHSLEIEVSVIAERFGVITGGVDGVVADSCTAQGEEDNERRLTRQEILTTDRAYFTFVSLPLQSLSTTNGALPPSALSMRPLVLTTSIDRESFEQGRQRYNARKALRNSNTY